MNQTDVSSPGGNIEVNFSLSEAGQAQYAITYKGDPVIETSSLGFEFKNIDAINDGLEIQQTETRSLDETWQPVWGERKEIRNNYNELLSLKETDNTGRLVNLRIRAYNDGLGFRFEFPAQEAMANSVFITSENTEFALTGDHTTWWIPADYDSYEYNYTQSKVSEVDASEFKSENQRPDRQIDNFQAVNTPVTMQTDN